MSLKIKSFFRDDCGAITVDWVLLTAGVISLTLAVMTTTLSGTKGATETVSSTVASRPIATTW